MGLSISNIKSLLQNPASAEYYLRMHISKLEQEIELLLDNKSMILSILDKLPVLPQFNDLYSITTHDRHVKSLRSSLPYDGKLVNHFLWKTFWEKENLTEYQQYLWNKINRLTNQREKMNTLPRYMIIYPSKTKRKLMHYTKNAMYTLIE